MAIGINQNVLRLYVPMADPQGMDIGDRANQLVSVQLDQDGRDCLLHLIVALHHLVDSLRDVIHHHVQINFIGLFSVSIEVLSDLYAVGVVEHLHDGEFPVLVALVLEDFLYGHCFRGLSHHCLVHYPKGPIPHYFLSIVG